MTPAQRTALAHHCRLASETVHPRFRHAFGLSENLILTVNSGYE